MAADSYQLQDKKKAVKNQKKEIDLHARDYHNALERTRRRLISVKFEMLKKSIPSNIHGAQAEKVPRCLVLKSACTYISFLERINKKHRKDIEKIKQENRILQNEIIGLENSFGVCQDYINQLK